MHALLTRSAAVSVAGHHLLYKSLHHGMPKMKYYAVKIGREGPKIYPSWDECKENTCRVSGAIYKSFRTRAQAEAWLNEPIKTPIYLRSSSNSALHLPIAVPSTASIVLPVNPKWQGGEKPPQSEKKEDWDFDADFIAFGDPEEKIVLSEEQEQILDMVERGESVFFTGSAGTGKSVLLREIIRSCKDRDTYERGQLAVTASTGIASVNIGGTTLHSWAGIGLGEDKEENLAKKIIFQKNQSVKDRWKKVQTLVVDEISMIDGTLFDKLVYLSFKYL
ncbi:hypothetical protein NEOLEDRAFT_681302 [Neolentinus lepideus HHB14362 ss-1]|uniref:ATP-dependent DNA helicase n=1 Tax=Neolentinus lepideus HHB14362 ss-1 TaxID=1314782 RepID=A0A165QA00_9AGAM|nr:hypothetical protein NEOLEDRAFT_681302 [Neolentinus lepideus HHB14362 ss-1]